MSNFQVDEDTLQTMITIATQLGWTADRTFESGKSFLLRAIVFPCRIMNFVSGNNTLFWFGFRSLKKQLEAVRSGGAAGGGAAAGS